MYDKEMIARAILSPFTSNYTNELAVEEAIEGFKHGVRSIVVGPGQLDMIKEVERKHNNGYTRTGMVVGYPFGGHSKKYKEYLTEYAIKRGIAEINLGINITAAKSGDFKTVREELESLVKIASGKINLIPLLWMVRIPLELTDKLCQIYADLGIKAVKTSPGIHFGDMKVEHVSYLAKHYGDKFVIEVAGRVRSRKKAEDMTGAGASYFHISQWKRIGGIGQDLQFDFVTKKSEFGEYKDRF
jgi:deoxyribose-phosphate aldolase